MSLTSMQMGIEALTARLNSTQLGAPIETEPPAPQCDFCGDMGQVLPDVPFGDPHWGKPIDCPAPDCAAAAAVRQRRAESHLKSSSVPNKYKALTFTTWYTLPESQRKGKELAAAAAWSFASAAPTCGFSLQEAAQAAGAPTDRLDGEQRSWLVLQGGMGLGKTGIAASIVNEMTWNGHPVFFYRLAEMFKDIQRGYQDGTADATLTAVQDAPALVLDEFNVPTGADGKATADKQRLLEEIIRYRHARSLPTVITCNLDFAALTKMWGERTTDVIAEAAHWIVLTGAKIRRGAKTVESF